MDYEREEDRVTFSVEPLSEKLFWTLESSGKHFTTALPGTVPQIGTSATAPLTFRPTKEIGTSSLVREAV